MPQTFAQLLSTLAARGDTVALRQVRGGGNSVIASAAELHRMALSLAALFAKETTPGALVPLLLGKSALCVAAMLAAAASNRVFACVNRKLRLPQIEAIFEKSRPPIALIDGPGVMTLAAGLSPNSALSTVKWYVVVDDSLLPAHRKAVEKLSSVVQIEYWPLELSPGLATTIADTSSVDNGTNPPQALCCIFTSGSTGIPKGVLIDGNDLLARARAEVDWFGLTRADVLLSILPFSFDVGLNQLVASLVIGCELVLLDSWLSADILRAAAEYRITGISGVPSIWADMMAANLHFDTAGVHAPLRYLTLSGGDLPADRLAQLPALAPGAGIHKTYGQSENFRSTALRPHEFAARPTSVGRAFKHVYVYVVRDDGTQCACGEEGEIVHTGLGIMHGYLGDTDDEARLKRRRNPFCNELDTSPYAIFTGDIGSVDDGGYLYVRGRRDAMLKVSGNRVYPAEIAAALLRIASVIDAEVIGVKLSSGDTVLVAFLVRASNVAPLPDLRREMAARLPTYMIPRHTVDLAAIPRTASGKPDRPQLSLRAETLLSGTDAGASFPTQEPGNAYGTHR